MLVMALTRRRSMRKTLLELADFASPNAVGHRPNFVAHALVVREESKPHQQLEAPPRIGTDGTERREMTLAIMTPTA